MTQTAKTLLNEYIWGLTDIFTERAAAVFLFFPF